MALRSGVSRFARPVTNEVTEASLTAAAHDQAESVLEAITEDGSDSKGGVSDGIETTGGITALARRGVVREPVSVVKPEPEIEAETSVEVHSAQPVVAAAEGAVLPKRRGPKPGTPRPPRTEKTTVEKAAPTPEQPLTAPVIRGRIKELETKIKEARARHEEELAALRGLHRKYHDQLFDLTK